MNDIEIINYFGLNATFYSLGVKLISMAPVLCTATLLRSKR